MAALIDEITNCTVSTNHSAISGRNEEFSRSSPSYSHSTKPTSSTKGFKFKVTGSSVLQDGSASRSWFREDLTLNGQIGITCNITARSCYVSSSIRDCTRGDDLHRGSNTHHYDLQNSSSGLVIMYANCGELAEANASLAVHKSKDTITWTTLIAGYARDGQGRTALSCFDQMLLEGIMPSASTYVYVLNACTTIRDLERGKQIHEEVVRQGLVQDSIILGNTLVDMYAKCGALSRAQKVLEDLPIRDVVSWNALMAGYAQESEAELVLNCLEQMQCHEGILPDAVTYVCALKACAISRDLDRGKQIHKDIAKQGLLQNSIMLCNALVNMYAKCSTPCEARQVLENLSSRNVVTWNTLIAGYADKGHLEQALDCFQQMKGDGISPNPVTYICIVKACAMIKAVDIGRQVHDEVTRKGWQTHISLGSALLDLYAKCGHMPEAWHVFQELPSHDVVSWSTLIAGYTLEGQSAEALNCLKEMRCEGITPNAVTFVCALSACAAIGDVERGKEIHDKIGKQGLLQSCVALGGALVHMYAKCGNVFEARWVLKELPFRNVFSWNALIAGYAQRGEAEHAMECLQEMQQEGIMPDSESCVCVLNVCGQRGLVKEGQELFGNMSTKYGLKPSKECHTSMIDLLGRAGHLEKAVRLIQGLLYPDNAIWHVLLGACQRWAHVNLGERAFEQALRLDKCDVLAYILMANVYAEAGMEEKAQIIVAMRIKNNAWTKDWAS